MNAHARFEENFSPDVDSSKTSTAGHLSAATGTFSLRRALYLNATGQPPERLPSNLAKQQRSRAAI